MPAWWYGAMWTIVAIGAALTPLVKFSTGHDIFRFPKELLLRTETILIVGFTVAAALLTRSQWRLFKPRWRDPVVAIPLLAVAWSVVTLITSTNRRVSVDAFLWLCTVVAIFAATYLAGKPRSLNAVHVALIPAALNATLSLLQASTNVRTATLQMAERLRVTALVGNPSDVGSYLVFPGLASLAIAMIRKKGRWMYAALFLLISTGLFVTQTITAIGAYCMAVLALFALRSWRLGIVAATASLVLLLISFGVYRPLLVRFEKIATAAAQQDYNALGSYRLEPFLVALEMTRDRPVFGFGPGTFGWNFYPYKLDVQKRFAGLIGANPYTRVNWNYGEVHNDHLEILAETGIPGYLIFLGALIYLARGSFSKPASGDEPAREAFSRALSLPLAVLLFLLSFGQFPLQLAAPTSAVVFFGALCVGWRHRDSPK